MSLSETIFVEIYAPIDEVRPIAAEVFVADGVDFSLDEVTVDRYNASGRQSQHTLARISVTSWFRNFSSARELVLKLLQADRSVTITYENAKIEVRNPADIARAIQGLEDLSLIVAKARDPHHRINVSERKNTETPRKPANRDHSDGS